MRFVREFLEDFARKWRGEVEPNEPTFFGDPRFNRDLAVLVDHPFSRCSRCDLSWKRVKGHATYYNERSGCFPLCEGCWSEMTPEERLPHYRVLFDRWEFDSKRDGYPFDKSWPEIQTAVLAGK